MLADIRYWENDATNKHYAIAHFNVWNAEMLMGVIDAAEEAKSPVIISFGTGFVLRDPLIISPKRNHV
ncbi:tagatose-bisphosphate aldolase [Escherichia coli]|nr:tagatose-bisphosphate aldolase [Escherichia coli]